MMFDSPEVDEEVFERGGVRLLVDKTSARLLDGAEIDYVSSVTATGFAIRNLQHNLDLWVRTLL